MRKDCYMETGKESTKSIRPSQIRMSGGKRYWRKVYVPCPLCEKRVCDVSPYMTLVAYTADDPNQPPWDPKMAVKCSNPKCGAEILLYPIIDPSEPHA